MLFFFFFFNDTATTEIYTLSLHDALPISGLAAAVYGASEGLHTVIIEREAPGGQAGMSSRIENYLGFPTDRKSTRLNSSHGYISYAVFCLKKKKHENRGSIEFYCLLTLSR